MLNIYLLRHGQTAWNADGNRYCGRTDLPLTEKGIQQAEAVREQLKQYTFDGVYASPLQRAHVTAQIVSNRKDVVVDDRIIEADFGNWEGKSREQFVAENETLWNSWAADPGATRAGETGETATEIVERTDDFFKSLQSKHKNGNLLVVAHNGVNRFYLAYKLGMALKDYRKLVQENSTISMFQLDETGELTLVHLNSKL